jgi:caffeoyl-CoA O-methyltransferase
MKPTAGVRALLLVVLTMVCPAHSQGLRENPGLDARVQQFLESRAGRWHDLNVPPSDGKLLFDLIVRQRYTRALEIGTSTGHSGIWIAWALSKTGGKLTTIEIDENRHRQAIENFRAAGLSEYIDARLADAHELVKKLEGPFDFVFSDADKGWYKQYFVDMAPKLALGGCFAAHNVSAGQRGYGGIGEFVRYVTSLKNFETIFDDSGAGMSMSYKRADERLH